MKKFTLITLLALMLINIPLFSQCVSGDCKDGYGVYKHKNGDSYEGYWKYGRLNGKGKYLFKSGDYQEGEWVNDSFEGYGTYFSSSDTSCTICFWENGRIKDGKVVIKKGNQIYYDGEMQNGRYQGYGILNDDDGDKYEGYFKDGRQNGIGKYLYADGGKYEGNFKDGRPGGLGKLYSANGDMYEGPFVNGIFEGNGKYFYADGSRYEGEFKNGSFNGKGILYFASTGTRFEGSFIDDKRDGFGTEYYAKGGKREGNWKNDEFLPLAEILKSQSSSEILPAGINNSYVIKLVKTESNVYEIPIKINNVLNINFIMDTGASELFITADVILTLLRTRTITDSDILDGGYYTDAQGNVNYNVRFNIKEIEIGGYKITNVAAGIADKLEANNLLGQNVLIQLKKFTIDFENETFTIIK